MRLSLALFALPVTTTEAFVCPPRLGLTERFLSKLHMSTTTTTTTESSRLTKAKQLLEEFQIDSPDGFSVITDNTASAQPAITTSAATGNNNNNNNSSSVLVSDNFWSNGHLQEGSGDFVTRWAEGKKVAEPLVSYDPIAAEKLLFRQPNRVSTSTSTLGPSVCACGCVLLCVD